MKVTQSHFICNPGDVAFGLTAMMGYSCTFQVQQFPKVRQLHKIGEVGK